MTEYMQLEFTSEFTFILASLASNQSLTFFPLLFSLVFNHSLTFFSLSFSSLFSLLLSLSFYSPSRCSHYPSRRLSPFLAPTFTIPLVSLQPIPLASLSLSKHPSRLSPNYPSCYSYYPLQPIPHATLQSIPLATLRPHGCSTCMQ